MFVSKRSNVRKESVFDQNIRLSLQTLSHDDTLTMLQFKISKRTRSQCSKLLALSRLLEELLVANTTSGSVAGFLDFEFGYETFSSFFFTCPTRKVFRDSLLDKEEGLPVLIYTRTSGQRFIILKEGACLPSLLSEFNRQDEAVKDTEPGQLTPECWHRALNSMTTEYDRWVAKMLLCLDKSNSELLNLDMKPERARKALKAMEERIESWEDIQREAIETVKNKLTERSDQLQTSVKEMEEQLAKIRGKWVPERVGDLEEEKEQLEQCLQRVNKVQAGDTAFHRRCFQAAVKQKAVELAEDRRVRKRARGAGPKPMMNEEDEQWLAKCIEDKTTVHGRRHESVLYTHHRVKNRDLLKLANFSRHRLGLPAIRSVSTVTSRARPTQLKSIQARRHKGLGLWCSKKPPKTEERDNECTHHQRKHVALGKEHLFGEQAEMSRKFAVVISMDDKAYLRPGTSEGFTGAKKQSILQLTDETRSRKLPVHDFPEPSMHVTPSAFRILKKKPVNIDGKTTLISTEDSSIAVIHPKAYIGTNGTTWASNQMRLRRECPDVFEVQQDPDVTTPSPALRKLCCQIRDITVYFLDTLEEGDVMNITRNKDCPFVKYAQLQAKSLTQAFHRAQGEWSEVEGISDSENATGSEVIDKLLIVSKAIKDVEKGLSVLVAKRLWSLYTKLQTTCRDLIKHIDSLDMPRVCPQILELTDAGPGVGVSNMEVRFRAAERVRIHSSDLLCRIHRARDDSGQNEAERFNATMGDAICDGGAINWQRFSPTHGLTEEEFATMTFSALEEHADKMTERNAWAVVEDIRCRIHQSPAPSGFAEAFTVEHQEALFFYNQKFLQEYMKTAVSRRSSVPGCHYFKKIETFITRHFQFGELYLEYLKGSCKDTGALCDYCSSNPFTGPSVTRIPRPYPDHQRLPDLKYLPYQRTPVNGRLPDDFQPRAQLKVAVSSGTVCISNAHSITEFSQLFVVPEDNVKNYVEHLQKLKQMQEKRTALAEMDKTQSVEKAYELYDWSELYRQGLLHKLRVIELEKYLSKHGLAVKGNKKVKCAIVTAHIGKAVHSEVLKGFDSVQSGDTDSEKTATNSDSEDTTCDENEEILLTVEDSEEDIDEGQEDVEGHGEKETPSRFGRLRRKIVNPDFVFF